MQAGKIAVKVHSASGFTSSPAASEPQLGPSNQVYVVCELRSSATQERIGRLCTEPASAGAGPDDPTQWEQELTFEVGPTAGDSLDLRAALYAVMPGDATTDKFIASGRMSLAHLAEVHTQRQLRVPLVTGAGAHLADLSLDLRFFHSRNPARQRDAEGNEYFDAALAAAGPAQAARLINERSPRSPTATPRPGSPRVKPPQQDPPVPELLATVRSTLVGEEE